MAYVTLTEFDVDLATHIEIGSFVGPDPIEGLIVHAGGPSENGVHSLDVWETREDAERFFAERLMPAMQRMNFAGGPPLSHAEFDMPHVIRGRPTVLSR